MFNSFFYSSNGEDVCRRFLSLAADGEIAIVVDPPFGGLAEVLARGIKCLWNMAKEGKMTYYYVLLNMMCIYISEVPTFLVFPYFMESHVVSALPSLWMMDYQVHRFSETLVGVDV